MKIEKRENILKEKLQAAIFSTDYSWETHNGFKGIVQGVTLDKCNCYNYYKSTNI